MRSSVDLHPDVIIWLQQVLYYRIGKGYKIRYSSSNLIYNITRKVTFYVFGFEYIWEVYKPLEKRRWGYYVLPILYGDDLVARLDPKLDRKTMTLHIKGFWLEEDTPVNDPAFADSLGKGLARFAKFVDAQSVDIDAIAPKKLRNHIKKFVGSL